MANPEEYKPSTSSSDETRSKNEWEEARCPICMDHPHNAVQLICSNTNCTCFICNTSCRHSNCLDRFNSTNGKEEDAPLLTCPLCRGSVIGWRVDRNARAYMDQKSRSCSGENCEFHGNYEELRSHARKEHPSSRPGAVDPTRQSRWNRLETRHELNDVLSAIRSAVPGAVVMGDYAIEPGSQDHETAETSDGPGSQNQETDGNTDGHGSWWTQLVLFDVVGSPISSLLNNESSDTPVARTRRRRTRRYLWGENLLGLRYNDDDDDDDAAAADDDDDDEDDADERHLARRRLDGDDDVHTRRSNLDGDDGDVHTRRSDLDDHHDE